MFGLKPIVWILINSVTSFVYLFIISKILGKKQIAQLEFIDYTVGISLGSISAEMSTSTEPFYYYLIAMTIFFLLALLVAFLGRKAIFLKRVLKGKPTTLVYEGKINYKQVCRANIDINDLLSMLREKGYFDITKVAYAIFEPSGKLSVMPKGEFASVQIHDLKNPIAKPAHLANILIVDGKMSLSSLNNAGLSREWLLKKLNVKEKKELKKIALAVYDNKKLVVHYKDDSIDKFGEKKATD